MTIKITFLGTSDSVPSAARNHPAFLLTYKDENILFDCGEGTQRQFRKAGLNPCKLTRILISHWHADHVLGIPGLLKTLAMSGYNKKLFIYGPRGTKLLMRKLLELFAVRDIEIEVKEVSGKFFENSEFWLEAEAMTHGVPCNAYSFVKKGQVKIDKKKLAKLRIPEGPPLRGLKQGKNITYKGRKYRAKDLTYREKGKKISFVIDTSINKKIVPFAKGADLLVCESTFASSFKEKAERYHHLTAAQSAEIAKKARVGKLFLIHVSQRFSKNPEKILHEAKKIFKNSHLPKDLDFVSV